ncbi:MAG: hypothetical protein WBC83_02100 [Minisyncoccia bacterium]
MFLAKVVRHFECHNLIIEARVENGHKRIFFAYRHSAETPDLCHWVFAYDNLEHAEYCLFEFDNYPVPIFKESTDGAEIINFAEKFKLAGSSSSPPEWLNISDSPFLEKCFALSVLKENTLFECS